MRRLFRFSLLSPKRRRSVESRLNSREAALGQFGHVRVRPSSLVPCQSHTHGRYSKKQSLVVVDHADVMKSVVVRSFLASGMPRLWASSHMQNVEIFKLRYLNPHCMKSNKTKFCRFLEACFIDSEAQKCSRRLQCSGKPRRSRPPPKFQKFVSIATTTPSHTPGTQKRCAPRLGIEPRSPALDPIG